MPYPSNQPRYEFGSTDKATMGTIANSAISFIQKAPLRGAYDTWNTQINGLTPTYKATGPFPDKV